MLQIVYPSLGDNVSLWQGYRSKEWQQKCKQKILKTVLKIIVHVFLIDTVLLHFYQFTHISHSVIFCDIYSTHSYRSWRYSEKDPRYIRGLFFIKKNQTEIQPFRTETEQALNAWFNKMQSHLRCMLFLHIKVLRHNCFMKIVNYQEYVNV